MTFCGQRRLKVVGSFTNCESIGRNSFNVANLGGFGAIYMTLGPFKVVGL